MTATYSGYMGKMPNGGASAKATCSQCRKVEPAVSMVQAFIARDDGSISELWCSTCWGNRGGKRPQPWLEIPAPADPRAVLGATSHKTLAEAQARRAKVAHHLGVLPEISPRECDAPGPFTVCPDSPLVPGFKAAKNPYSN